MENLAAAAVVLLLGLVSIGFLAAVWRVRQDQTNEISKLSADRQRRVRRGQRYTLALLVLAGVGGALLAYLTR